MRIPIFHISEVLMIENPKKLFSYSLEAIHSSLNDDSIKIIDRIYPEFFNSKIQPEYSGVFDLFFNNIKKELKINLSDLELERIPLNIAKILNNTEHLDLSRNMNIKIIEEWFTYFYSNLKELSLNECNISEEDFKVLRNLKKLEKLDISGNRSIKCISEDFMSVLENLTHLDISNCNINSSALETVFIKAKKLEWLKFNGNDLSKFNSDNIPHNIKTLLMSNCKMRPINLNFRCEDLIELDLSHNDFSESIFDKFNSDRRKNFKSLLDESMFISNCNLKILNLSFCKISSEEFIEKVFELERLENLNISSNTVKRISNNKSNLRKLTICNSYIPSLEEMTNFKYLEELDISNSRFNDKIEYKIGCSKYSLKSIKANNCNLHYKGLSEFTDCPNLERLFVSKNCFFQMPSVFKLGLSKDSLKILDISNCNLNHDGLKAILECPKLEELNCSWNDFEELTSKIDCRCLKLKKLDINNTQLTHEGFKVLTKLYIQTLDCHGNSFENIPTEFDMGNLKDSLVDLNIVNCLLNINGLKSISNCRKLKYLVGSWNFLENLPSGFRFGDMKYSLKSLDLRASALSSNIFEAISECTQIENLNLFGNIFDKDFTLGLLKRTVKVLDMSFCKVQYSSLKEITDCIRLIDLKIGHNNFSDIPEDFVFGRSINTLEILDINSCNLNYNGLKAITDFSKLEKLIIINNNIGNIPTNFTFRKFENSLKFLDVRNCRLNHTCLKAIHSCKKLECLNIGDNNFEKRSQKLITKLKNKVKEYYE